MLKIELMLKAVVKSGWDEEAGVALVFQKDDTQYEMSLVLGERDDTDNAIRCDAIEGGLVPEGT